MAIIKQAKNINIIVNNDYTLIAEEINITANKISVTALDGDLNIISNKNINIKAEKGIKYESYSPLDPPVMEMDEQNNNTIIYFERCKDYMKLNREERKGEIEPDTSKIYGFDNMESSYKDIYGYYWDTKKFNEEGVPESLKDISASYSKLEEEYNYKNIIINKKNKKYYVPWISIDIKQKIRISINIQNKNKSSLLSWKDDYSSFLILPEASSLLLNKEISIECIDYINTEKEIILLDNGIFAGSFYLVPNNKNRNVNITWCLVDISGKNKKGEYIDSKDLKDKLTKKQISRFVKNLALSQALVNVIPTDIPNNLKLSDIGINWDKYTTKTGYKYQGEGIINANLLQKDLINEYKKTYPNDKNNIVMFLINRRYPSLNPIDEKNKIITEIPGRNVSGFAIYRGAKYIVLFDGFENHTQTVVHEILHCLNLHHSFEKEEKHHFKIYKTNNYLDYVLSEENDNRDSLWKWQWELIWKLLDK